LRVSVGEALIAGDARLEADARLAEDARLDGDALGGSQRSAWTRRAGFAGCALGTLGIDWLTKGLAFAWLGMPRGTPDQTYWLWPEILGFTPSLNAGAIWGWGQNLGPLLTGCASSAALALVIWMAWLPARTPWSVWLALGLVQGGLLGNLLDRLGVHGLTWNYPGPHHTLGGPVLAVRDWIDVRGLDWPLFNLADLALLLGGLRLLIHFAWPERAKPDSAKPESASREVSSPADPTGDSTDALPTGNAFCVKKSWEES